MKSGKDLVRLRSFKDLPLHLKNRELNPSPSGPLTSQRNKACKGCTPADDHTLFLEAMADVTPLDRRRKAVAKPSPSTHALDPDLDLDAEALAALEKLVQHGEGFVLAHTSEYIEGAAQAALPDLTERLHRGDFSVQAHIDLHGHTVPQARTAFENFMKEAIATDKRTVLIVHGRGRSSPVKPVLKSAVSQWLNSGPWRKWVIAYASARACDGGTGATYVLLRPRPRTKRQRKPIRRH